MTLFWNKNKHKIKELEKQQEQLRNTIIELQEQLELAKTQLHNRITNCNKRINRLR